MLSGQVVDTEYEVLDVRYSVHTKRDAPPNAPKTMRVDYRIGQFTWQSEFICFEHTGYARWKAEKWWQRRSPDPVPQTGERAYSPFAVYALLEHGGDFTAAACALRARGFGGDSSRPKAVDLSGIASEPPPPAEPTTPDPGPMPEELLDVPGFIRQVTDYTLSVSPYPQPVLAFAAALVLQAFLASRKIRDAADDRTNLYVLALANSGAGKNEPRKVNQRICVEAGLQDCLGDAFASGEGIEDRLFLTPSVLFQTDEIDGLMHAINQAADARHENIMNVLLKMYTSSSAIYPLRVKAGGRSPGVIDQPSLCMLGTAVPKYYYEALSVRMLNNGFFARLIVPEAGKRGRGQTPVSRPIPEAILRTARWWADFRPGEGNLQNWHPIPVCVAATPEAEAALEEFRALADDRYAEAEDRDDPAGMAIWARDYEKARKLALVYAASRDHLRMRIDEPAVRWAWRFVDYQTRRMLFMAGQHVAEGEFDARCKANYDLGLLGFSEEELAKLLDPGVKDGLCDPDEVPEPPDEPTTRPGDLWLLGEHRLLCGDAGKTEDVDRLLDGHPIHLVHTDPPYNVRVDPARTTPSRPA